MPKIIAVTGATGTQGGSIARRLLDTKEWHVRAVTRDAQGDAARKLAAAGAEVVTADMDDEASLKEAFRGAHAVFAVTNYWEHLFGGLNQQESGQKELEQAMNLARAAAQTPTLQHYIWSTQPPAGEVSGGKFPCLHCDYKARADDLIRENLPSLASKTTFIIFSWYCSNFAVYPFTAPIALPGGDKYVWPQPCSSSTMLPVTGDMETNAGLWVRQILASAHKTKGRYILVATQVMSMADLLKMWSEVTGKEAVFLEVTGGQYEAIWGLAGRELASQYKNNEAVPDWECFRKADFVNPQDIGIGSEAVGPREALENLKDRLIWAS